MSNQYEQYATKVTDNDILLLKKVIDTSYLQIKPGDELVLQDILNNFNILCSEMFDLTESHNAFLYAVILKMSEFTEFKLPKVISFLNISADESNPRRNKSFTWYTRLEMIHEYIYYHHLYTCFYEFNTLNTAFYFMRLQYAHQIQYKKMTYYDSSQLKKSKWTIGDIKGINKIISSTSSSSSSGGDGSGGPYNNQKQFNSVTKTNASNNNQNEKTNEESQNNDPNDGGSQFSAFESNPSFSDKVDKITSYLQQLADDNNKISKTLSQVQDAAEEAFQNAVEQQQQKLQESQQFALYSKNNGSVQTFKRLQETNADENSICEGVDDFPQKLQKLEASQIENDALYKSVKPVIEQSAELSKKEKQSFLEFMDGLLYAGNKSGSHSSGKYIGELGESIEPEAEFDEEQDEMHDAIIQEIKRQEAASRLRVQSLNIQQQVHQDELSLNKNQKTTFDDIKSFIKESSIEHKSNSSERSNSSSKSITSHSSSHKSSRSSQSDSLVISSEQHDSHAQSIKNASSNTKSSNQAANSSSGSFGPKNQPKYDMGLNAGTLTRQNLEKSKFRSSTSSSNEMKCQHNYEDENEGDNQLSEIIKSISNVNQQLKTSQQVKNKHPAMVQDAMSTKLSKLLIGEKKLLQDSPIQMKQNLNITEYSSYQIIDAKKNSSKLEKQRINDQISQISVIEKPTTIVLSPEEIELENRLKLEILSQNLQYVGQQLQNQSLFIGFIQWRSLTQTIVHFKVRQLRRAVVAIVAQVFATARTAKQQQDDDYEILKQIEYRRRKQRGLAVIRAFREFYRQQRPNTFFEQGNNDVVKYFANNFQMQISKAYYKLITDKLDEKVSKNEALRDEMEKKYYKQVKAYQYVKPDPLLYQQLQDVKEKILTDLQNLSEIKAEQQKILTKHQKMTTLTVEQFNKYKSFKYYIEMFPSTNQMTVKIADRKLYEFYKELEDFLNKNLIILCKQYIEQQKNQFSRSVVNIPSKLQTSMTSQDIKTLFQDVTKETQVSLLQKIQLVPIEVLKLGIFQLICKFIKSHMSLGYQLIPASQYSLRRPIDYLNLMIFSFKYQNYSKQIFFSVLKFLRDVNQCKVNLLIQRRFMRQMRTYTIIRHKITTVKGYIDVIYEQKVKQYVMKLLLDELYERQFLEEFWDKQNQKLLKQIFKMMKSYVKEKKLGGKQFIMNIENYYQEKIKSKALTELVNQYIHITICDEKVTEMHTQITKFTFLSSLINVFKADYYYKQIQQKKMQNILGIMVRKRYVLNKKCKQLSSKIQLHEGKIITQYCLQLMHYKFNKNVNFYAKISKKYKKETIQEAYISIKKHYLQINETCKRIKSALLLFSAKKAMSTFKKESNLHIKMQQHIHSVNLRRLFNLFGMWKKMSQLREKRREEIYQKISLKHEFIVKKQFYKIWRICYYVLNKNNKIRLQKLEKIFLHWQSIYKDRKQFQQFVPVLQNIRQCMSYGPEITIKNNYKKLHPIQVCRFLINNYLKDELVPVENKYSQSQILSNTVTRFDMQMEDLFDDNKYLKRKCLQLLLINKIQIKNIKQLAMQIKNKYEIKLKLFIMQQLQIQSIVEQSYGTKNKLLQRYTLQALLLKRYELNSGYIKVQRKTAQYLQNKCLLQFIDAFSQSKEIVGEFQSRIIKLYSQRIIEYFRDSIAKYNKQSDKIRREHDQKMLYQTLKTMKKKYISNNHFYVFIDQLNYLLNTQIQKRYLNVIRETVVNRIADRFYFTSIIKQAYSNLCNKYQNMNSISVNIKQIKLKSIIHCIKVKKLKIQQAEQQFDVFILAKKQLKLQLTAYNAWKLAYRYDVIQNKLKCKYEIALQRVAISSLKKEVMDQYNMRQFIQVKEQNIQRILMAKWRKVVNLNTMSRLSNKKLIFTIVYKAIQQKYNNQQEIYKLVERKTLNQLQKSSYVDVKVRYSTLVGLQSIIKRNNLYLTQKMYLSELFENYDFLKQQGLQVSQKINKRQINDTYQQFIMMYRFINQTKDHIFMERNKVLEKDAYLHLKQHSVNLKVAYQRQQICKQKIIFNIFKYKINNIQNQLPVIEQQIIQKQNNSLIKICFNALITFREQLTEKEEQCNTLSNAILQRYTLRNVYVMHRLSIIGKRMVYSKYFQIWDRSIKKYKVIKQQQLNDRLCQQFIYKHNLWQLKHIYLNMNLQYKKICEMMHAADNFYKNFCLKQWHKCLLEHQKQNGSMSRWELMQKSIHSSIVNE